MTVVAQSEYGSLTLNPNKKIKKTPIIANNTSRNRNEGYHPDGLDSTCHLSVGIGLAFNASFVR